MAYNYNPLLRLDLQKKQNMPEPPAPMVVDDELSPTSTNAVQNRVITNKIEEITSDSIDIDVNNLAEFVAAVERSADVSVRIHLRADISLAENLTVNLDNCQIYGHDNRIFLENHTFLIQGEYCYFYQVRFNASSLVTSQTANQSDYFDARIKIVSTKASTRFFFEYVIFMNFICHSFDKQHTIIEVDTTSSGYPSLHTYFLYCEVMTNYLGTNLPRINDCVWSLENVGNSLNCITAKIIDYWGVGFDGTNYDSTKNFNFSGNPLKGFAKLGFTSDASINYAASPSGYTSLTPNAVNIYNPSSVAFEVLYNYVHGNHFATYAQGVKADSALQAIIKGTDGDYIIMTITEKDANKQQSVSVKLTVQPLATADNDHKGLAESSDVIAYINNLQSQINSLSANIPDVETFHAAVPNSATEIVFAFLGDVDLTGYTKSGSVGKDIDVYVNGTKYALISRKAIFAPKISTDFFYNFSTLTALDLSNFNTTNVSRMDYMFSGCAALTALDLSNFNTANVTKMHRMFYGCAALTALDLSNFNTANVTNMSRMFEGCAALTALDLSNFNTANVTDMSYMFYGCAALTALDMSNFNTTNVSRMNFMFYGCAALTALDLSNFNTTNVSHMTGMFNDCAALTALDLSNFNTANVTDMSYMFSDCGALTKIIANDWSSAVTSTKMFYHCTSLVGGNGTTYKFSHTDAAYAHIDVAGNPGYFTAPPTI